MMTTLYDSFGETWLSELILSDLPRPYKGSGWIPALRGIGEPVRLPLMVARGPSEGPTVMAVAGVHGNEYEGMAAIRRVFADLDVSHLQGMFVAIPVANPFAFEGRGRVAPVAVDGLNLARVFPGNSRGTPSLALAHLLLDFVSRHVGPDDLFIDFHSGSHDVAYATIVGVRAIDSPGRAASERAARHFGITDLWLIPESPGPLNAATSRLGIPTIATETLGRAGCDPAGTAVFTTGLQNLLSLYGTVTAASMASSASGAFRSTYDLLAPCGGILDEAAHVHQPIAQGDLLGTIVDIFGHELERIIAPCTGTVWAARASPAVHGGELLFTIAYADGFEMPKQ